MSGVGVSLRRLAKVHYQSGNDVRRAYTRPFEDSSRAPSAGYKQNNDFNGGDQEGAGGPINVVNEVRQSTAMTYLTADVRNRPNLAIKGNVNVDRVLRNGSAA